MRVLILRSSRLPNMAPARSNRRQERLPAHTRRRLHQAVSAQPDEAVARRVLRHRPQAELREPPDRVVGPQIGQRHVKVRAGDGRAGHALGFVHRQATRGI